MFGIEPKETKIIFGTKNIKKIFSFKNFKTQNEPLWFSQWSNKMPAVSKKVFSVEKKLFHKKISGKKTIEPE